MDKLKQRITNPMTIIAIFATLSETSAAISLPFLDDSEREIYVWFLISFPFYLLLLFFATLNFNYRSLYAPADFEKSKHFLKVMGNERSQTREAKAPSEGGLRIPRPMEHYIRFPKRLKDLYIIDVRGVSKKNVINSSVESIQDEPGKPARAIVFITCADSEVLLKASALDNFKHAKKSSTFCATYNLSSNDLTIMEHDTPLAPGNQ